MTTTQFKKNLNKYRIIEIAHNWPAETFLQRHVLALEGAQYPVQVVARHASDAKHADSASLGSENADVNVQIMPNFNHLTWLGKLFSLRYITTNSLYSKSVNAISGKVLLGYFERMHPDLIHFHDATLAASMCWIPLALGIPYTLSMRGSDIQVFPLQSFDRKKEIVIALVGAVRVHAVCRDLGRRASELAGCEIDYSTIYTTVPLSTSLPVWNAPVAGDEIRLVSSGRLMWRKGFDSLLIAIRCLRDRGTNARLTLIGVGPDMDQLLYLRKMLGLDEFVDFPGKLDYEQIKTVFKTSHAYIQSSVAEGLSNSLAEAMANGLPVFATDVGGTREVIEDGVTGVLLPPFEPWEWAEKFLLVRDPSLMMQVRTQAFEKAQTLFIADHHARAFVDFFDKVLKPNVI